MNKIFLYKLQDEQRLQRANELLALEEPTDLSSEIVLLRLYAEAADARGDTAEAARMVTQIGKLTQITEATNIRRGELLQKQVVLQLALQIARIQTDAVKGRFDGWETVMDDVRQKVLTVVSEAQNPDPTEK